MSRLAETEAHNASYASAPSSTLPSPTPPREPSAQNMESIEPMFILCAHRGISAFIARTNAGDGEWLRRAHAYMHMGTFTWLFPPPKFCDAN